MLTTQPAKPFTLPSVGYFALVYHVVPEYTARRGQHRDAHLRLAWAAHSRGELLLGGAFTDPADSALLIWRCDSRAPIQAFIAEDPYVLNGLVSRWEIREWNVVIADAPMPLGAHPAAQRLYTNLWRTLDELALSTKTYDALRKADLKYVGELVSLAESDLVDRGVGAKSLNEINAVLDRMDLDWEMELDDWPGARPIVKP